MTSTEQLRFSVLAACVSGAKKKPGRTALMKYAYLLQTVRGVPLGYRFRLYNYGPYDEAVLADARMAADKGLLESKLVTYSSGYGYEFETGERFEAATDEIGKSVSDFSDDIQWVMDKFSHETAARLELISTIVFARCDETRKREKPELVDVVHEIKPHFSKPTIASAFDEVSEILSCISCDSKE